MRKLTLATMAAGMMALAAPAAHADPLTDWVLSLFGVGMSDSGATPDGGPGDGTGVAD